LKVCWLGGAGCNLSLHVSHWPSVRHVGERFQRSNETCPMSRYFRKILDAVSSGPFYQKYVYLPNASDPV
ncbi:hypothetical protein FA13DRAFT_1578800, partial [Coprinellus micaceus]